MEKEKGDNKMESLTIDLLKEEGKYIGFDNTNGWLYELNGSRYAVGKNGLKKIKM